MRARVPFLLASLLVLSGCVAREEAPSEPQWRASAEDAPVAAAREEAPRANASREGVVPVAAPANDTSASAPEPDPAPPANATVPRADPAPAAEANATTPAASNATAPANAPGNATANATSNATDAGVVLLRTTHSFANGGGLLGASAEEKAFDVPEGYARVVVNLTFVRDGEASLLDREASVGLVAPNGTAAAQPARARPGTSIEWSVKAASGEWTLEYQGRAAVEVAIVVRAYRA